jgi:hypothetical protein
LFKPGRFRAFSFKTARLGYHDDMSVEQIESKLMELPAEQRREFARWFYDHEEKILNAASDAKESDELRRELVRRRADLKSNPGLAVPVTNEWFQQLKEKLSIARASKASAS